MVTAIIASVTLVVYALIDCARTPPAEAQLVARPAWLGLIALLPVLGALAWLLLGRPRHHRAPSGPAGPAEPRPSAPDDDEDFLRALDGDDGAYRRRLADWERDLRRREGELRGGEGPPERGESPDDDGGQPAGRG